MRKEKRGWGWTERKIEKLEVDRKEGKERSWKWAGRKEERS